MPRRHKTMKGGFLDDLSNTLSGWGTSISDGASSFWQKTKDATSSLTGSTNSSSTSYFPTTSTTTYGGKHKKSRRHMKGGYNDNIATTGLAAHAASFSGQTAKPQTMVGGKTRRRRQQKAGKSRRYK